MNSILRAAGTRSGTSPPRARIPVSVPSPGRHDGFACRVDPPEMADELASSVVRAAASVAGAIPAADAILGSFVGIAALIRSVSVHEGRLLEEAMTVIGRRNPDLVVLERGVRLPVTAAALEAVRHNKFGKLSGLTFDADARARETYAPDLVVVNRRHRAAFVIDVKRSLASYLDTHRLTRLKTRMLAASLILPDWLYKERKRLTVDTVGIAIVDGASGTSEHECGLWSLSEIDELLEVEGAAEAMSLMRESFAERVQELIRSEILKLSGRSPDVWTEGVGAHPAEPSPDAEPLGGDPASDFPELTADTRHDRVVRFGFARPRCHS